MDGFVDFWVAVARISIYPMIQQFINPE